MKQRPLNSKDGFRILSRQFERANTYPRGSEQRLSALEDALLVYLMMTRFSARTNDRRRGRTRHRDDKAVMVEIAKAFPYEKRPYILADLAIDAGMVDLNNAKRETVRRRLRRAIDK
jgi:hypothetical protein